MKKIIIVLLIAIGTITIVWTKEYNDSNQDHPKSIRILYSHNYCPWEGLKNYSITIEEFLQIADASIYLTDEESLKYFKGLQRISESNEEDVPYYNFDTWFSAIVDYGTYKDTVSVSKYLLQYNDRSLKDTSAVFYFISKIFESDRSTFVKLNELYYDGDFHKFQIEENKKHVGADLLTKLQDLDYVDCDTRVL